MSERKRLALAAGVLLWLLAVLVGAFMVYKPINPAGARALLTHVLNLLVVGWLATLAGGLGFWILGPAVSPGQTDDSAQLSTAERIAWTTGLGLGLLALATLALAAVGGLHAGIVVVLLVGATVALRRPIGRWFALLRSLRRWKAPADKFGRFCLFYLAAVFGVSLLLALLPPHGFDALVYHLTIPKLILQSGHLDMALDLPYLGFPQLGEMLFTLVMALRPASATQLVSLLYGGLLALGLYGLAARRWGKTAGLLAGAVLFSAPTILNHLSWPYVDVMLMFYLLATFAALERALEAEEANGRQGALRWLLAAGLFAGMGMGAKYTAVMVPVGAALVWLTRRGWRNKSAWRGLLVFGLAAAAFTLPWLLKNWVQTGNPVYPFVFGGPYWDEFRAWWYSRPGSGYWPQEWWKILLAPWYATTMGREGAESFDATIGPLFLALAPLAALGWRRRPSDERRWLADAALLALPSYLPWLVGIGSTVLLLQTRLLFPVFPLLALLATAGLTGLGRIQPRTLKLDWLAKVLVALVLALNLLFLGQLVAERNPWPVLMGVKSETAYLEEQLGFQQRAIEAVNELPAGSKVLFLWEPRSFYCEVECWPDALLDRWWHLRQTVGAPAQIAAGWRAEGFTHLLVYRHGYEFLMESGRDPLTTADIAALEELLTQAAGLEQDLGGYYQLYSLR